MSRKADVGNAPSLENLHIRHLASRGEVLAQPVVFEVLRNVLDAESRRGRRRLLILAVKRKGLPADTRVTILRHVYVVYWRRQGAKGGVVGVLPRAGSFDDITVTGVRNSACMKKTVIR